MYIYIYIYIIPCHLLNLQRIAARTHGKTLGSLCKAWSNPVHVSLPPLSFSRVPPRPPPGTKKEVGFPLKPPNKQYVRVNQNQSKPQFCPTWLFLPPDTPLLWDKPLRSIRAILRGEDHRLTSHGPGPLQLAAAPRHALALRDHLPAQNQKSERARRPAPRVTTKKTRILG